jgi:hypothetical protein
MASSVPLVKARKASFEALNTFPQARYDVEHGARADANPLFDHAIALDPKFASADAALAVVRHLGPLSGRLSVAALASLPILSS